MTYLVTGATGGLGGYALNYLKELVPMSDIYALVRSKEKGADLKAAGFNIRVGDYSDAESMKQAFAGIDRVLFVSGAPGNRQVEHENVINAAKKAGVSYIAYTSFAGADKSTSALAEDHFFTEKEIEKSGIAHTFLRNNWYFENEMPMIGG
ncbi:NAD(P)H-binding protein, partial [Listeria monocytogenes]